MVFVVIILFFDCQFKIQSLDPAKMNRGIFVNRSTPNEQELNAIVTGICRNDKDVLARIGEKNVIDCLCKSYLNVCEMARHKTREFFGLRDFYALIKMIYWHIKAGGDFDWTFLNKAVKRNFGGLSEVDACAVFKENILADNINIGLENQIETNVVDLIKETLQKRSTKNENRYLLLLSHNDNILELLNNYILEEVEASMENEDADNRQNKNVKVIFGSSFPNDQQYSQICRMMHQIKLSMELGKTVVLLNLEHLYESLYDALNQFYHRFGNRVKFVDLGLGTQRVKCLVSWHFIFHLCVTKSYSL